MNNKELEQNSKKEYWLSFGCIGIELKQPDENVKQDVLQEQIIEHITKGGAIIVGEKESYNDEIVVRTAIGEGLGAISNLTKPMYISSIYLSIVFELETTPVYATTETNNNVNQIKVRVYYNGFAYCIVMESSTMPKDYYHGGHIKAIHNRIKELLSGSEFWLTIESEAYAGQIKVFVLPESYKDAKKRDDSGIAFEYSAVSVIALSCKENDKDNTIEAILDSIANTAFLYVDEYYCCALTETQIKYFTEKLKTLTNDITNSVLSFYELNWINIFSRYNRSVKISRMVAQLYPLIPHIDKLLDEYNYHFEKLKNSELIMGDAMETPYREFLSSRVSKKSKSSSNIEKDMVSREVTEINSQVNYQFIFLTFLVAIIGIVASIIFTHR